jgi:hypothetical protein
VSIRRERSTVDTFCRFPETKERTLEEIGILFGDKHVASQWYGLSEEEKMKIRDEAMMMNTKDDKDGSQDGGSSGLNPVWQFCSRRNKVGPNETGIKKLCSP